MAGPAEAVGLAPESDALSPLPPVLRKGLTAVAVLGAVSFTFSALVLFYLTCKLARWHVRSRRPSHGEPPAVDLALGLAERHFVRGGDDGDDGGDAGDVPRSAERRKRGSSPNQFLILIYNLLLADMEQASAFLLNASWLAGDSIRVGSRTCFAQGWLVSVGDLASSLFIGAIAVHTYLTVVWEYKPRQRVFYAIVVAIWLFAHLISALGIIITHNGRSGGGFYVRAAAWCWINVKYEKLRLLTHYLFIFISLALTTILYALIFFHLRRPQGHPQPQPGLTEQRPQKSKSLRSKPSVDMRGAGNPGESNPTASGDTVFANSGGRHPAFLIYPVIHVVCTAPLAFGRIATMAGAEVPLGFFCAAGALITSNGWLDVLLFGVTRRWLLFSADVDTEDSGIGTFNFMRTPHGRKYGNMVWVQGPGSRDGASGDEAEDGWSLGWAKEWMGWRRLGFRGGGPAGRSGDRTHARTDTEGSQESLRGAAGIQMDLVTTVVVEVENGRKEQTGPYGGDPSASSMSVHSSDKDLHHQRL